LKLLVDSRQGMGLMGNAHQVLENNHNILLTEKIELSLKTCVALWNVNEVGLYDQHILFANPDKQSSETSALNLQPAQLDEQLEDILDIIDLETAILFLRKDARKNSEVQHHSLSSNLINLSW
jgi:Trm5-related predicted tRNA methylase